MGMGKIGSEQRPRWLKWLHRIGYVTTIIVLIQILGIATFITIQLLKDYKIQNALRKQSSTHERPLLVNDDSNMSQLLRLLPSLDTLQGNGFRFVADPDWFHKDYALALYLPAPNGSRAKGVIIIKEGSNPSIKQHNFTIPANAYRTLVKNIDKKTDSWKGSTMIFFHYTTTAFERVRGKKVTSGIGQGYPYTEIQSLILTTLKEYAPNDDLPKNPDWTD